MALLQESFVIAGHQLGVDLLHDLQRDTDPDQDRDAGEAQQAEVVAPAAQQLEQQGQLQAQLDQMASEAGRIQQTLGSVADEASSMQANVNGSFEKAQQTLQQRFAGLEKGLTSLSSVLEKLGEQSVVVQQVAAEPERKKRRRGWF